MFIWKAGLYGRVSTEHEEQQESIKVQKDALLQYAHDNGYEIVSMYFDEGCSGTDFNRPGIKMLRNDIENSRINLIIVKDLSRIGRNNTQTLMFLDYLSQNTVRLIAVGDNYDTFKDEDDLIGIRTWVNERYSKELSQKIRFAIYHKKRKGEYLGAFAPYGYKKAEADKNKLEIDYFAADVVKKIFELYINGYGFMKIAAYLQQAGIPNPSRYGFYGKKSDRWDWTTIKKIITNPVYTGMLVQHKYKRKSFKDHHLYVLPQEEWIKVENTHEHIIDKDTFECAQQILAKRRGEHKYRCGKGEVHLFTSFLYCGECGSAFYYRRAKDRGVYMCSNYVKYGTQTCSSHSIAEDELKSIISDSLRDLIVKNINKDKLVDEIVSEYMGEGIGETEITQLNNQLKKYRDKIEMSYRDRLNGMIDADTFMKIKDEIEKMTSLVTQKIEDIKNDKASDSGEDSSCFCTECDMFDFLNSIDRMVMELLISRITINKLGDVTIYYNFSV